MLGVHGGYLVRVFMETRDRPSYMVKEEFLLPPDPIGSGATEA